MWKAPGKPNLILDEHGIPAILSGPLPHELQPAKSTIPANETDAQRDAREKEIVSQLFKKARHIGPPRLKAPFLTMIRSERPALDPDIYEASKWYMSETRQKAYVHEDAEWTDWGLDFGKSGTMGVEKVASMRVLEKWTDPKGVSSVDMAEALARMREEERQRKLDEANRYAKKRKLSRDQEDEVLLDKGVEEMPGYKPSKNTPGVLVPLDWVEPEPTNKDIYTGPGDQRPGAYIEPPHFYDEDDDGAPEGTGFDGLDDGSAGLDANGDFSRHNLDSDGFLGNNKPSIKSSVVADGNGMTMEIEANTSALQNGIPIVGGIPLVNDVKMANGGHKESPDSSAESSETEKLSTETASSPESATTVLPGSSSDSE